MVRGSWFVVRGLGFVAKDAMEIAADSDCRRLRCAVAAERSEGRATHRERGDSRATIGNRPRFWIFWTGFTGLTGLGGLGAAASSQQPTISGQ